MAARLGSCDRLPHACSASGPGGREFAEGWNFGPHEDSEVPVSVLVQTLAGRWGADARWELDKGDHPHEAAYLKLDCGKARTRLGWRPVVDFDRAMQLTSQWYRAFHDGANMRAVTLEQISCGCSPADCTSAGFLKP